MVVSSGGGGPLLDWLSQPAGAVRGVLAIPGDKSISHRALMLAALADGRSHIRGFLEGDDTRATATVLGQLGVLIEIPAPGERVVHGAGLRGLRGCTESLDCGNAGTGMRLLAGLMAGQAFDSVLVGDASLSRRPMRRVTEPLARMGARVDTATDDLPPLHVYGGRSLQGINYALPIASAQVKSALLLAGLYAHGETHITEPHPTRDYTERMLQAFGWPIEFSPGHVRLSGGHALRATHVDVPADFSSAAFFVVAASIAPGSDLLLPAIGLNPRRTGLLDALRLMGADITVLNRRNAGGEPVGDLRVRYAPLHGIDLPAALVADMIDEFPAWFIAAAVAEGISTLRGAAELRVKESDRLAVMAAGLRALGVVIAETADGATIHGGTMRGGSVHSHGDHRMAMSFALAGLVAHGAVHIQDCANVATSFPGFIELATQCGFALHAGMSQTLDK